MTGNVVEPAGNTPGGFGLLDAAFRYAALCWPVFPVVAREKVPATANGFHDATSDVDVVRRWWTAMPDANIGISCGLGAIVTVDLDGDIGEESWSTFLDGRILDRPEIRTGRGRQLVFEGEHVRRRIGWLPGVDVCGTGGYSILPPSVHPSGARYAWTDETTPRPMPRWLFDAVTKPRCLQVAKPSLRVARSIGDHYARAALERELETVRGAVVGSRNSALVTSAFNLGQLVGSGDLERDHVVRELFDAATGVGLGETESLRTIVSGMRAGLDHPRQR